MKNICFYLLFTNVKYFFYFTLLYYLLLKRCHEEFYYEFKEPIILNIEGILSILFNYKEVNNNSILIKYLFLVYN